METSGSDGAAGVPRPVIGARPAGRGACGLRIAALALALLGGTVPQVWAGSLLDRPAHHIATGFQFLDAEDVDRAEAAFARALALDPRSAAALAGQALVAAARRDGERAEKLLGRALGLA